MKLSQRRLLVALTATAVVTAGLPAIASADPEPTTGVELVVGQDKFVGQQVTYDPASGINEGVAALQELRGYMWDQNPPFVEPSLQGSTLQEVARSAGFTTKEEYQRGFSIDGDLTWTGVQRATEAVAVEGHRRPDGSEAWTAKRNGTPFTSESLGFGAANLRAVIIDGWGKRELQALRASNGSRTDDNGHLHQMINPKNRAYGFGAVTASGTTWTNYYAAASSEKLVTPANFQGGRRTETLYRAAKAGEQPTGITAQQPAEQPQGQQPSDQPGILAPATATGSSGGTIGTVIGIVALIITLLGGIGFAINFQF